MENILHNWKSFYFMTLLLSLSLSLCFFPLMMILLLLLFGKRVFNSPVYFRAACVIGGMVHGACAREENQNQNANEIGLR